MKTLSFNEKIALSNVNTEELSLTEMTMIDGGSAWGWVKKHWGDTLRCAGGTIGGGIVGGIATSEIPGVTTWIGVVGGGMVGASSSCHF
jgi:hypothetical protein